MRLVYALVACAALLPACKGCSDQEITPIEDPVVQPDLGDIGRWLSMAVTADGKPAVAYYDVDDDALAYAVGTIGADGKVIWAPEKVDSYPDANGLNPGDAGKYASLVIDAAGTPWIVYQDSTNGTLKYATKDGDGWKVGIADVGGGARSDAGYWASLALDPGGNPVAVHHDNGQGSLRIARWNGTGFSGEVVYDGEIVTNADGTSTAGDAGAYAKLRYAADGTAYVAFHDEALGALRLARSDGGAWSVEVVDDSGNVGTWPDLQVDATRVTIAYADKTNGDLKLASGSPGAWTLETVDNGDTVGEDVALVPGGAGIVYMDGYNADMKLARRSGDAWVLDVVTGADGARGFHNEVVNIGGTTYVACYDFTARTIWFSALPS